MRAPRNGSLQRPLNECRDVAGRFARQVVVQVPYARSDLKAAMKTANSGYLMVSQLQVDQFLRHGRQ